MLLKDSQTARNWKNELETVRNMKHHIYLLDQFQILENLMKNKTVLLDNNQESYSKYTLRTRREAFDEQ